MMYNWHNWHINIYILIPMNGKPCHIFGNLRIYHNLSKFPPWHVTMGMGYNRIATISEGPSMTTSPSYHPFRLGLSIK